LNGAISTHDVLVVPLTGLTSSTELNILYFKINYGNTNVNLGNFQPHIMPKQNLQQ
jgi:hypothetical protein